MTRLTFIILPVLLSLAACGVAPLAELQSGEGGRQGAFTFARWQHRTFPGKQATGYTVTHIDGRAAVAVQAESSASMLRQTLRIEPHDLGRVKFSWKVPELIAGADLGEREAADSPGALVGVAFMTDTDNTRSSAQAWYGPVLLDVPVLAKN